MAFTVALSVVRATPAVTIDEFHHLGPATVVSGPDSLSLLPMLVERVGGHRAVVVTNHSIATRTPLLELVTDLLAGVVVQTVDDVRQHSPTSSVDRVARVLARTGADVVVGIGGGSVCDTVKAATVLAAAPEDSLPHVAIPTTLSGAEFTAGIGVTDEASGQKLVSTDPRVLPQAVILDPNVAAWTPTELWSATGVKALDHAIEAIWCRRPHPVMTVLAIEGLRRLARSLGPAQDGTDLVARADCQIGAWMAITRPGRSAIRLSHLLGHQVGACWGVPHGVTSAVLLPTVMRYLAPQTLDAQQVIASALGIAAGIDDAQTAARAADHIAGLVAGLGLPGRIRDVVADTNVSIAVVAEAAYAEAVQLGCADDLPDGVDSVRHLLQEAW